MTSNRRSRVNQINAQASTGPRTEAGKARSSKNARRHGLNIPIWNDPTLAPQAERIARRIAGSEASDEILESARRVGAAQIDIVRIRARRRELIERLILWRMRFGTDQTFSAIVSDKTKELTQLDRYERRAFSRRMCAIRHLDDLYLSTY